MRTGKDSPEQMILGLEWDKPVEFYQAVEQGHQAVPHISVGFHSAYWFRGQARHQGNRDKELIAVVTLLRQHVLFNRQKDDLTASGDVQSHSSDPVCSPAGEMKSNFL